MQKDLKSYLAHHSSYSDPNVNSLAKNIELHERYRLENLFVLNGFELAIKLTSCLPSTHIDIGSGTGWLLRYTSRLFKNVIGIEPSEPAVKVAQQIYTSYPNISFVNQDMVDALQTLSPSDPVFLTTAIVLSHINNEYVAYFLAKVNELPIGSVLYFDEGYDKNINTNLWYIRSRQWWAKNLPNWQIVFLNLDISGYKRGIYGVCVGDMNVLPMNTMGKIEKLAWNTQGLYYTLRSSILRSTYNTLSMLRR